MELNLVEPHSKGLEPIVEKLSPEEGLFTMNTKGKNPCMKQEIVRRTKTDRVNFLLSHVSAGKEILHVGCSDSPYTDWSLSNEHHVHAKLLKQSPGVVGLDNCNHSLNKLRRSFPNSIFIEGNVESLQEHIPEASYDTIIAGEILEHLSNPGCFLEGARKILKPDGSLVITVPNAFGSRRLAHSFFGKENYHSDHAFYFSENTLKVLAERYSFSIESSFYYATTPNSFYKKLLYMIVEDLPARLFGNHFLDGIAMVLKPKKEC